MIKYSIIIPVVNNKALTDACLTSILKHTTDYEIIIVDNGSKKGMYEGDSVIRNEENLGFPVAINQGIAKARGEIIVLLNNDTIVTPYWLDRLADHFDRYDIISPLTNNISGIQQLAMTAFPLPASADDVSEKIYAKSVGRSIPYHRLVFFCVAIKRSVIDKIGVLDERFSPGNCEDDDYCLRAIEAGFRLGIATDCFIYHAGSATHKALDIKHLDLIRTNQAKLQAKYPREKYEELKVKSLTNCDCNPVEAKKTVSLVMIARNEEMGLERAVNSARPYVDKVIIAVDRSSTDKTLEIATRLADVVKTYDWQDDFAWARNFAHEGVDTDWILFLDGHEFIKKAPNFFDMLNSPADGLLCTVLLETGQEFRNPRIYRKGLQFSGAIHEMQNCKTLTNYSDFVVEHDRPGGQAPEAIALRAEDTNDQIPRIMGKQLADDPANIHASFHLAMHAQSRGRFSEAIKYQNLYLKYAKQKGERWYMLFNKALCHYSLGHKLRALCALDEAEKETPSRWEVARLRALMNFYDGKYKRAIGFFVDSFDQNFCDVTFKPWQKDEVETWDMIGQSYYRLTRYDLAKESFARASDICLDETKKKLYQDRADLMLKMSESL